MTYHKKTLRSQTDINLDNHTYRRMQREIPTDSEELERLLNERGDTHMDDAEKLSLYEKRRDLVNQLFVAASKVLTNIQYQIFSAYFVIGMSETQIAEGFKITQPYCSIVLTACIKKIKKHLNIQA